MLKINPEIFKAYDIRGIYGQDFDDNLAYLLGPAFIKLRQIDPDFIPGKKLKIAVASDMRLSSPSLKESLMKGLLSAGAEVVDLGLVATPTFYFAVANYQYDGGIMISASHNPKEWNGFKLVRAKSSPISGETGISFLKEEILNNNLLEKDVSGEIIINEKALDDELKYTWSLIDQKKIKKIKIIADAANSMGALYLEKIFAKLPGESIALNFNLDGNFPAHEADPLKEENLEELKKAVISKGADLGIASDGDGDRIFFVDDRGEIWQRLFAAFVSIFLKRQTRSKNRL